MNNHIENDDTYIDEIELSDTSVTFASEYLQPDPCGQINRFDGCGLFFFIYILFWHAAVGFLKDLFCFLILIICCNCFLHSGSSCWLPFLSFYWLWLILIFLFSFYFCDFF